jgi:TPR repeat protein
MANRAVNHRGGTVVALWNSKRLETGYGVPALIWPTALQRDGVFVPAIVLALATMAQATPALATVTNGPGVMKGYNSAPDVQERTRAALDLFATHKDDKKVYTVLVPEAKTGNRAALTGVGMCLYFGRGIKQDRKQAYTYIHAGAELGYLPAERLVGMMLYNGEGCKKDPLQGFAFLKLAELQGDAMAHQWVDQVYGRLSNADRLGAQTRGLAWLKSHTFADAAAQARLVAAMANATTFPLKGKKH